MTRRGIILAEGSGTPLGAPYYGSKQAADAVYDKPMIHYPLSTLMLAGIKEVLIITTPHDQAAFQRLLGDGSAWACPFSTPHSRPQWAGPGIPDRR